MQMNRCRRLTVITVIFLATLIGTPGFTQGEARAQQPMSFCSHVYQTWTQDLSIKFELKVSNDACSTDGTSVATGFIANCSSSLYTQVNAETWQTRQLFVGGIRYGDTGKTGNITYPPNCYFYQEVLSYVNPQLLDPSYGCGWDQINNNQINSCPNTMYLLFPSR